MVSTHLRVSYHGSDYDVSSVPGVCVGEKLLVCENPWAQDTVQVVMSDDEGHEAYQVVQRVTYDQFGMVADAPVIGESYARHADTPAQTNAKALELMATDTSTETEAKAARKAGTVAFGGQIDPFAHIDQALEHVPATLPRRGRDHDLVAPTVHLSPLSHIQAAKQLKPAFSDWSPEHYTRLQALYPEGVPADAIDAAAQRCAPPWRRLLSNRPSCTSCAPPRKADETAAETQTDLAGTRCVAKPACDRRRTQPGDGRPTVNHALWPRVRQHQLREATIQF